MGNLSWFFFDESNSMLHVFKIPFSINISVVVNLFSFESVKKGCSIHINPAKKFKNCFREKRCTQITSDMCCWIKSLSKLFRWNVIAWDTLINYCCNVCLDKSGCFRWMWMCAARTAEVLSTEMTIKDIQCIMCRMRLQCLW